MRVLVLAKYCFVLLPFANRRVTGTPQNTHTHTHIGVTTVRGCNEDMQMAFQIFELVMLLPQYNELADRYGRVKISATWLVGWLAPKLEQSCIFMEKLIQNVLINPINFNLYMHTN